MAQNKTVKKLSKTELNKRLKKIRLLILDIDGVLTDGRVFWLEGQGWTRHFHVHDGYGIRMLKKAGVEVAVFSGSKTEDIHQRMKVLGITHTYLGNEKKMHSLKDLIRVTQIHPSEMAFVGDDLFDIPVLRSVGLSFTVPQALAEVKKNVHAMTTVPGGFGAVREVADLILKAKGCREELFSEKLSEESYRVSQSQNA